jgi:hypothetical protein
MKEYKPNNPNAPHKPIIQMIILLVDVTLFIISSLILSGIPLFCLQVLHAIIQYIH